MYSFCNDLDREDTEPEVTVVLVWYQRGNIDVWISKNKTKNKNVAMYVSEPH